MLIQPMDVARDLLIPMRRHTVHHLHGGGPSEVTVPYPKEAIQMSGLQQRPDAALHSVFPIRDPARPDWVHPDYAHDRDRRHCHPRVRLVGVRVSNKTCENILSNMGPFLSDSKKRYWDRHRLELADALAEAGSEDVLASLEGRDPPSKEFIKVVPVTRAHCASEAEAAALAGQSGAIAQGTPESPFYGWFAGAKLVSEADFAAYEAYFGAPFAQRILDGFSAEIPRSGTQPRTVFAPFATGADQQYCNSRYLPSGVVDKKRVNASLQVGTLTLLNKWGEQVTERLYMVVSHYPLTPGTPILLDYGPRHRFQLSEPERPLSIKREDPDPSMPGPQQRAPDLQELRRCAAGAVELVSALNVSAPRSGGTTLPAPVQGWILPAPQPSNNPRGQQFMHEYLTGLGELTEQARASLEDHGAQVVPNSGSGLNCLIIALLQHAQGHYTHTPQMSVEAQDIRQTLGLGEGMLLSDDPNFRRLVQEINRRYATRLNVTVAQAAQGGLFLPTNINVLTDPYGRPETYNTQPVLLLQGPAHYEAVILRPSIQLAQASRASLSGPAPQSRAASSGPGPSPAAYHTRSTATLTPSYSFPPANPYTQPDSAGGTGKRSHRLGKPWP